MNKLKLTFAIGFLSLIVTLGKAQTYKIDTSNITFEDKLRPCYQVKVDPEPKDLKKAWAKYLKKNYSYDFLIYTYKILKIIPLFFISNYGQMVDVKKL